MIKSQFLKVTTAGLVCWGVLIPNAGSFTCGAEPTASAATRRRPAVAAPLVDVALKDGGLLDGQVVDAHGQPVAGAIVALQYKGREIARTRSGANGTYQIKGLRGGPHNLTTSVGNTTVRLWAGTTAPPQAKTTALLVATGRIVRGQAGVAYLEDGFSGPIVTDGYYAPASAAPAPGCNFLGMNGIDVITLGSVGLAAGALVVAIDNNNRIDKLADKLDDLPQSP